MNIEAETKKNNFVQRSEKTVKSRIRTIFVDQWYFNPYQKLLVEHLTKHGLLVEIYENSRINYRDLLSKGKPLILHLHFLDRLFIRRNILVSLLKFIDSFTTLFILKCSGVKIIWTVHELRNFFNVHVLFDFVGTFCFSRLIDAFIVHSNDAKKKIIQKYSLKRRNNKIYIIPHGNYIESYKNEIGLKEARQLVEISAHAFVFLVFGSIVPRKGLIEIIQTFSRINLNAVQLMIVGKPVNLDYEYQIQKTIEGRRNIKYVPKLVPDYEIQMYMNGSNVVVLPYKNDFLTSGVLLLAMSFGKACIVPKIGYFAEILDDGGAFFYDAHDKDGMLRAMQSAIVAQRNLSKMGRHNLRLAKHFSWERSAGMIRDIYYECLNQ